MGTTLDHGIYLPDEGERNCYDGLAGNWVALDNHLGSSNIHVTINDKQAWNGHVADTTIHVTSADKQAWNGHVVDSVKHVTAEDKQTWNGKADASALTAHTGDTTIHVTAEDKQAWNGKQDALSQTQLDAVNSGIDGTKVQQIATNTSDISSLQSGKANDSDVVHKSGVETINGRKTFSEDIVINNSDTSQASKGLVIRSSKVNLGDGNSDTWGIILNAGNSYASRIIASKYSSGTQNLQLDVRTKDSSNNLISSRIQLRLYTNGFSSFEADTDNTVSLGFSSVKFKDVNTYLVNGVEPSSLSLPSGNVSDVIDISSYITDLSGGINEYTASVNGWITITCLGCTGIKFSIINFWANGGYRENPNQISSMIPICKGQKVGIYIYGSSPTIQAARFIPCQGNV